jgi:plasmid stabilization system protein ParE
MSLQVVFHPKVFSEVDAIMNYYERVACIQLADDFYAEFRLFIEDASDDPEKYNTRRGNFRRVNLKRFPFNFLFRVQENTIRILVVRHHARQPTYGTKRI